MVTIRKLLSSPILVVIWSGIIAFLVLFMIQTKDNRDWMVASIKNIRNKKYIKNIQENWKSGPDQVNISAYMTKKCYSFYRANLTTDNIRFIPFKTVMMKSSSVKIVCSLLHPNMSVLEWGSGGSTLFFSKFVKSWHSIEHNFKWSKEMKKYISKMENSATIHLDFVAPSPNFTRGDGTYSQFSHYIEKPTEYNLKFDLIIVDGRARVSAAYSILRNNLLASKSSLVIVHDWQRPYYHEIKKKFRVVIHDKKQQQSLVVLKPKY